MSIKVEQISGPRTLGEGPHWDAKQQCLFYVDIPEHTIHKYCPNTQSETKTKLDGRVGFIIPVEGSLDQFVVGVEHKFLVIEWDGTDGDPVKVVKELFKLEPDDPSDRINDGKIDPKGRLFAGTMGHQTAPGVFNKETGALYRVEGDRKMVRLEDKIGLSNGLAWDLKEKAFYYTDSLEKNIRRYDYDVETGAISNKTYVFDFTQHPEVGGSPDGMTIDSDGNLWVAVFGGSAVIHINPRTKSLIKKIPIPATQTTSVNFGGPDLDVLFVTSAAKNFTGPTDGCTFKVSGLGAKGLPNYDFKLN